MNERILLPGKKTAVLYEINAERSLWDVEEAQTAYEGVGLVLRALKNPGYKAEG